jgi:dTDP-4-dehydrorhamnose reductase
MVVDCTPPLPLLISGVAGVAGYNAFHYFHRRYPGQVIGTRRPDNWPLAGEGIVPCELHDRDDLARLFDQYQFKSVLNVEGLCKLKSCELNPTLAERVNVEGLRRLVEQIQGTSTRLVHVSVDLVYSGDKGGGYLEDDPPDPVTVYGKTMWAAEDVVVAQRPDACILRMSLPMGVSFSGHAGAIDWIQSRFRQSKPATLFYDEIRNPKYTDCLNLVFEAVLANDLQGIYHAGGPRRLSLFEIAQVVNRVGGYAPGLLCGCNRHEAGPMPPRAGNVTMNTDKLTAAFGYDPFDPWPLEECWVPTHREWHHERPQGEPGSPELLAEVLCRNPARQAGLE